MEICTWFACILSALTPQMFILLSLSIFLNARMLHPGINVQGQAF